MKKLFLLLASSFAFAATWAQEPQKPVLPLAGGAVQDLPLTLGADPHGHSEIVGHSCKAHELTEQHYQEMGMLDDFHQDFQQSIMNSNANLVEGGMKTPGTNTISVIFHVVYNTPAENVSNALIMSVFNDLSEDFQLLNADAANARTSFGFTPADANINFCLATQTPAGVPLTEQGVVRVATTETFFDSDGGEENAMKSAPLGSPIWNRNNYLNIWICDISNGATSGTAGYAYMPSGGCTGLT